MSERRYDTTGWDKEQVRRQSGSVQRSSSAQRAAAPAQRSAVPAQQRTGAPAQRSGSTAPRRKKKKKRINPILGFLFYIIFVVAGSALLAGVGWLLANDLCALNKEYIEVTLQVTKEDTVETVTEKLKEEGLIEYDWFFRLFAWVCDADEKIGEGEHVLNTNMDYRALIVGMKSKTGQSLTAETVTVTIPEGYTVAQTIKLLAEKGVNTEEALTQAAQTYRFTKYAFVDNENLGDISRLEGYLFPNTYEFYVGEKASSALGRLLDEFSRQMDEELSSAIEASGKSLKEIVIIASLIEEETDGGDRAKISSVIHNRIQNPGFETAGLLQIDAALIYGTGDLELTEEDKQADTPYNLYLHAGLPPTAISNPGRASLLAAAQPEQTNYYYYVLGNDGNHIFSTNYNDHINAINRLK